MDEVTKRPIADRIRTILVRGAAGTIEAGLLRRPLRSARVRDDGVVVLVVDVGGMSREAGDEARMASVGATATVEVPDTVCTGVCRAAAPRPSFALDGRRVTGSDGCGEGCAVTRGIVTLSGIVTAASGARRRKLVASDGGRAGSDGEFGSIRLSELQPLEITYLDAGGVHVVSRSELSSARVDPIGVDESDWLRRIGEDSDFAARLALRAGRQIAGTGPRVIGIDSAGLDLSVDSAGGGFREVLRLPFSQACRTPAEVECELAVLRA